jgi:hypothetical protein
MSFPWWMWLGTGFCAGGLLALWWMRDDINTVDELHTYISEVKGYALRREHSWNQYTEGKQAKPGPVEFP